MEKKQLIKFDNSIYRVLYIQNEEVLLIDCIKRNMPKWKHLSEIGKYIACDEKELLQTTETALEDIENLDAEARSTAYQRYTIVASILPFLENDCLRTEAIKRASEDNKICKQTVRNYLCLYLAFQSVSALAPEQRSTYNKALTEDEKVFRWAINKYYFTAHKNSLKTCYTYMLKERYCNADGTLAADYPSYNQFRYYFSKYKKMQTFYISRNGMKDYQRNYRPLLGDKMQEYSNHIGIGEIDATICDIHLVDDKGNYIGRPILTIMIDSFSRYIYGYSLTLEGGTYSLRNLLLNCISAKKEWCREFGIVIGEEEWNTDKLPGTIVSDMGAEYQSETFSQITELGISLVNLPPLRPELKAVVERSFQLLQQSVKPSLIDYGYVDKDAGKRLAKDYRKNACLTLRDYEKVIIYSILYNNNQRIISDYPYTEEMLQEKIAPHPKDIFTWGRKQDGADIIPITSKKLIMTLLPRTKAKFSRKGLIVFGLRYDCKERNFTEEYLSNKDAVVAYNPDNADAVYLYQKGRFTEFQLIESRFIGKSFEQVEEMIQMQREIVKSASQENLQGRIDLTSNIEIIIGNASKNDNLNLKNVKEFKEKERRKHHKDFVKEAVNE
ncbi:MAG: transposase family protein [Ruminococcus flavefaciens]|nr:transposase family protein [Ruminococcus flavefaciens]